MDINASPSKPMPAPFSMTYNPDGSITFSGTLPAHRAIKNIPGMPIDAESVQTLISATLRSLNHLPPSRELSLVKTKLQEAQFWAFEANGRGKTDAG